jgi:peroxiredoxin
VLEVGAAAPDFELRDQHARSHRLSSYRERSNVLLVFFPFAFTRVCTGELEVIRDQLSTAYDDGQLQVLAVSCDPMGSLRAFGEQQKLDFPLLSDFWPHGEVARCYGVFNDALGAAERGTFLVDRRGVVAWTVRTAMGEPRDVAAYHKALAEL